MTRTYSITEPHPSVPSSHYMYSGRGGAGNISRVDPTSVTAGATANGPASRTKLAVSPSPYYSAGRGGAGNLRSHKERAIFSFDEELAAQQKMQQRAAPVYHIGRGGAGNFIEESKGHSRKNSSSSESSQEGSMHARRSTELWNRMSRTFSRN